MTNEEKAHLLILNMKRSIELLEETFIQKERKIARQNPELKAKMHEVRRDSIALEKIMYPDWTTQYNARRD